MPYETDLEQYDELDALESADLEITEGEFERETDSPLDEIEEMEQAAALLEITDEAELDQFIGKLLKKASSAAGKALQSPLGRALGGLAKGAIKKALPGIGGAVGGMIAPGVGSAVGARGAAALGNLFGLELEGLSTEDQEYEIAKRLVRLISSATKKANRIAPGIDARSIAKNAFLSAARKHAPGLVRTASSVVSAAQDEYDPEAESPFNEVEEMEYAAALLDITDEAELDQFLGSLVKKAAKAAGTLMQSPVGRTLTGYAKAAAQKALPKLAAAIGGRIVPGAGSRLGTQAGARAVQLLGLEAETLTADEQEFELARRIVRTTGGAARHLARQRSATIPHRRAAMSFRRAARRHFPRLLRPSRSISPGPVSHCNCGRTDGQWVRSGDKIILLNS